MKRQAAWRKLLIEEEQQETSIEAKHATVQNDGEELLAAGCLLMGRLLTKTQEAKNRVTDAEVRYALAQGVDMRQRNVLRTGDIDLYSKENMKKRDLLRKSPRVQGIISTWWKTVSVKERVNQTIYSSIFMPLYFKLVPKATKKGARTAISKDWKEDSKGKPYLDYDAFFYCLFTMADTWCDTCDEDEYVEFLEELFKASESKRKKQLPEVKPTRVAPKKKPAKPKRFYPKRSVEVNQKKAPIESSELINYSGMGVAIIEKCHFEPGSPSPRHLSPHSSPRRLQMYAGSPPGSPRPERHGLHADILPDMAVVCRDFANASSPPPREPRDTAPAVPIYTLSTVDARQYHKMLPRPSTGTKRLLKMADNKRYQEVKRRVERLKKENTSISSNSNSHSKVLNNSKAISNRTPPEAIAPRNEHENATNVLLARWARLLEKKMLTIREWCERQSHNPEGFMEWVAEALKGRVAQNASYLKSIQKYVSQEEAFADPALDMRNAWRRKAAQEGMNSKDFCLRYDVEHADFETWLHGVHVEIASSEVWKAVTKYTTKDDSLVNRWKDKAARSGMSVKQFTIFWGLNMGKFLGWLRKGRTDSQRILTSVWSYLLEGDPAAKQTNLFLNRSGTPPCKRVRLKTFPYPRPSTPEEKHTLEKVILRKEMDAPLAFGSLQTIMGKNAGLRKMTRDLRMPWGYHNTSSKMRPAYGRSPSPAVGRSSSPAPRGRRSASPSANRKAASPVLSRRMYRETREETGAACWAATETNRVQDALEARVRQLEEALRAEQEGSGKLFETVAQLRQDNTQLRDIANVVELTQRGREAVSGVRRGFGGQTVASGGVPMHANNHANMGIGIEEVPVSSSVPQAAADPIPGCTKALLIGATYAGTRNELPHADECVYGLQNSLQLCGFLAQYKVLDSVSPPTKQNILQSISWLVEDAQPGDSLVFAFCGHSVHITGAVSKLSGIAPIDWEAEDIISELDLKKLLIESLPAGVKMTCVFDLVGGGVGVSMPNVLVIHEGLVKEDSDVVPAPSPAHVVTICNAWSPTTPVGGSLMEAFSRTITEIGSEMLMADFLHSLAKYQSGATPIRVGSSALELKPIDVFCFGVLPVHRGPRSSITEQPYTTPIHPALVPPSTSTPAPTSVPPLPASSDFTIQKKETHIVGASKALIVECKHKLVTRFLSRQGFGALTRCTPSVSFSEEDLRWLVDDAMPGDSLFFCITYTSSVQLSLNDILHYLIQQLPQGVRLTWVIESESQTTHPSLEHCISVTNEGLQQVESATQAAPLVLCVSGRSGLLSAYMAAMNRDSEPAVSQLCTAIATIMASSSFEENSSLEEFNIRASCSKRWSMATKMHLGLLAAEPRIDVSSIQVDSSSLPPTPRSSYVRPAIHGHVPSSTPTPMPPTSFASPAAPVVPVPAPIPATFKSTPSPGALPPAPSTPVMAAPSVASLPPQEPPAMPTASLPVPPASLPEASPTSTLGTQPAVMPDDDVYAPRSTNSLPPPPVHARSLPKESTPIYEPEAKPSPVLGPTQENCKRLLVDFCSKYDPTNLPDVPVMLADHAGDEELLLEAVAMRAGMPGYFTAKKKVTDYYIRVNPSKVDQVDTILSEYLNAWDELFHDLQDRYGDPFDISGNENHSMQYRRDDSPRGIAPIEHHMGWGNGEVEQELAQQSPQVSPARALARPIQFDTTTDTIDPQYIGTYQPSDMTEPPLPVTRTGPSPEDDALTKRKNEAEERYKALKEQTDSFKKRVEALKDSRTSDVLTEPFWTSPTSRRM